MNPKNKVASVEMDWHLAIVTVVSLFRSLVYIVYYSPVPTPNTADVSAIHTIERQNLQGLESAFIFIYLLLLQRPLHLPPRCYSGRYWTLSHTRNAPSAPCGDRSRDAIQLYGIIASCYVHFWPSWFNLCGEEESTSCQVLLLVLLNSHKV